MSCKRIERVVFLWVDRGRDDVALPSIERHLAECPKCRARAVRVEKLVIALRSQCRREAAPPALSVRIRMLLERS